MVTVCLYVCFITKNDSYKRKKEPRHNVHDGTVVFISLTYFLSWLLDVYLRLVLSIPPFGKGPFGHIFIYLD